ncbi:BrnA antitoxin family protein [Enterovirga aerilata]|uniref:BrnA antitoxin family protein n=1 Tax=Enterovirga aerilata TaxID=2730920 RepID=A0A849IKP0_9HYPH|nr:BrnA antitoxin family protein [Enterovirga sp. DB1703]NNM74513.1 BrnA antitoxin family protein [Enterovirga sp. DB1703]
MPENRDATKSSSPEIKSDLAKVDAYVLTQADYDEIPELTDEWFEAADFKIGDKLIRRGRPKSDKPKKQVTLRLDADLLDGLRATGPGWQTRINEVLRDWLEKR